MIDNGLPSRPPFHRHNLTIVGETVPIYMHGILKCIQALYGDAEFAQHLIFKPEQHYMLEEPGQQLYHDMHTRCWWWEVQVQ